MSESTIDSGLIRAYLETEYHVHSTPPAVLRIGEVCPELAALHRVHRLECSAYITACNPLSETLDERANAERQLTLARELTQRGLAFLGGIGQHPRNQWPGEASFLILGATLSFARELGARLEQNAIVWSGCDARPQSILLR